MATKINGNELRVASISEGSTIQDVPLGDLRLSALNPRERVTEAEIAAMAASIRTVGLAQNLAGLACEDGAIEIVAGGRRLRALQLIAEEDGADRAMVMVPVLIASNEQEAQGWASAENFARTSLHPAEEVRAYRDMAKTGALVEVIASAFAVTVRHVKGRMRMAELPEIILDALREDQITLDAAAAYTVSNVAKDQVAVFESLTGSWAMNRPGDIRARLMSEAGSAESLAAAFVGRDAYEAAGGAVREDLFGDDVWFLDTGLLSQLAEQKLETEKAKVAAEGWKWVEAAFERPDWQVLERYARTYPAQAEPAEDEAALFDELSDKVESGEASEAELATFDDLSVRLLAEVWSDPQKALSGVILWIGRDGAIAVERGLVAKEDRKAAEAIGVCHVSEHSRSASKPKGVYSAALSRDLALVRTGAVQSAVMAKPDLAFDLVAFALSHSVYSDETPLRITARDAVNRPDEDAMAKIALPDTLAAHAPHPLTSGAAASAFETFRSLPKKARMEALAVGVARSLSVSLGGDAANPLAEIITGMAKPDVRALWTPEQRFLGRLSKAQILDVHDAVMEQPAARDRLAKAKKADLVQRLHDIFAREEAGPKLNRDQRKRADAWLPDGMAMQEPDTKPAPADAAEEGLAIAAE